MTIAIGVLCSDGIVLCADSQETFNEYAKLQRAKVFELDLIIPNVKVVVAGSGDSNFYDALRERLEDGIDMADPDLLSVRTKIEEVIIEYCNKIWPLYAAQKDRPSAQMLIGIQAPDGLALLHTEGPIVKRSNQTECIGFGADFSTYHLKRLFNNAMLLAEVWPIAIYVLALAKEHVEFCGGDSHVFVVPKSGDVEQISATVIQDVAQKFNQFANDTDKLIARAAMLKFNEPEYFRSLASLYKVLPVLAQPDFEISVNNIQALIDGADVKLLSDTELREFVADGKIMTQTEQEWQELKHALEVLKRFIRKAQDAGLSIPVNL